jgi:hypothetical protein
MVWNHGYMDLASAVNPQDVMAGIVVCTSE